MGNKASKAATAVSARTVLARRAAEQQSSAPGAPAAAASAGKQHQYQPEALPSGPQPDIDIDINPKLIDQISRMELIKTKIDKVTADGSHLAVMIRKRKDEELIELQEKEKALVVGRGRLSERDVIEMLESIRRDPKANNPIEMAKKYNLGIHTVVEVASAVRAPLVMADVEGNLYAV